MAVAGGKARGSLAAVRQWIDQQMQLTDSIHALPHHQAIGDPDLHRGQLLSRRLNLEHWRAGQGMGGAA